MEDDKTKTTDQTPETPTGDQTPDKPTEDMIPASRLRGLIKEKSQLEQRIVALEETLNSKKLEGMTEVERLKAEKDALAGKTTEWESKYSSLETRLKRAAVLNHFKDAATPRVADLVDLERVELDGNGDLTDTSKVLLKDWRNRDENKPLFQSPRRGGNTPAPASDAGQMTKADYVKILNDPNKTQAEKQQAHERYLKQFAG